MLPVLNLLIPKVYRENLNSFWQFALFGLLILVTTIAAISGYHFQTGIPQTLMSIAWALAALIFMRLSLSILWLIASLFGKLPKAYLIGLLVAIIGMLILYSFRFRLPSPILYYGGVFYLIGNSLLFGILGGFRNLEGSVRTLSIVGFLVILAGDIYGIYWFWQDGSTPRTPKIENVDIGLLSAQGFSNPAENGDYKVGYFTYGSGSDQRRSEFSDGIKFKTPPVDGTKIISEWKGDKAKWRKRYWGFGAEKFPLNGRVWMPEANKPAPLILIVHGNHTMEDHSDGGYGYLAEMLASHGNIVVSVDENFINGTWSGDFRGKEMPARAWLLLKHLEQWREWNTISGHELSGKIDLENITLIGHSRGGEAVAIAAAYNRLSHFPDDATVKFDFNFGIRGLVAIAPTDKRYQRRLKLENVSYLTLQGSYDSDEASYFGLRQSHRINYSDSNYWVRAGAYIHGANHGQFNSTWGRKDSGAPWNWILNLEPIIKAEDQREIAKVYIGTFCKMVSGGDLGYVVMFKNSGSANDWLPETPIMSYFKDSEYQPLISYEDDIDVKSWERGEIKTENLKIWREEELKFRDDDTQGVNGAILGWDYGDEMESDSIASYSILSSDSSFSVVDKKLVFTLSQGNLNELSEEEYTDKVDFSLRLTDSVGTTSKIKFSDYAALTPQLPIQYLKIKSVSDEIYGNSKEAVLETFFIAPSAFSGIELGAIKSLEFVFDASSKGVLILDEIGLN
ncbi:MAG: hypothetical protein RJQ09_18595 [Cyclobacteriaceae bacterium]